VDISTLLSKIISRVIKRVSCFYQNNDQVYRGVPCYTWRILEGLLIYFLDLVTYFPNYLTGVNIDGKYLPGPIYP
jgi:hypothetical protein